MLKRGLFFIVPAIIFLANFSFGQVSADFDANIKTGCVPVAVSFQDKSIGIPTRWLWEISDGRTSDKQNPSFIYLDPGSYTVKLTVYRGNDSSSVTKMAFINIYGLPVVNFTTDVTSGCLPLKVNFTNQSSPGSGSITTSIWDYGDGNTGTGLSGSHTYVNPGRFNVTLTIANNFGCRRTLSLPDLINVFDSVDAAFDFTIRPFCTIPVLVDFTDNSNGSPIIFRSWDFGDGSTSILQNPAHTYANSGVYDVRLIVGNSSGCRDTILRKVSISLSSFTASFNSRRNVCRGENLNFINTTNVPLNLLDSVRWTFGDGTNSTDVNPSKTYTIPGNYVVRLIAFYKGCTDDFTRNIRINPNPSILFSGDSLSACKPPLTVNFTNPTSNATVVRWDFGNGLTSTAINPTITYDSIGSYSVKLVMRSANGCVDSLTRTDYIKILPPVIGNLPPLSFEGCFPWTNTFNPSISSIVPVNRWEWDFGDGRTSTDSFPTITYSTPGEYTIKLKVFTASGCADSIQTLVRGGVLPVFSFTADPLVVCPLDPVTFTSNITNTFDRILWEFGDGGTSVNLNPTHLYMDTGYMKVILRVFSLGCTDSLAIEDYIYVKPPIARFKDSLDCNNQFTRIFTDNSIGAQTWFWDFGNGDTSILQNPVYIYPDTGTYQVTLRVTNDSCKNRITKTIYVLRERPDFIVTQTETCNESIAVFTAAGDSLRASNIQAFTWTFNGQSSVSTFDSSIVKSFSRSRTYSVGLSIADLNGCFFNIQKSIDIKIGGPEAIFGPAFQTACLGDTLSFTDSSIIKPQNTIAQWVWSFGDGLPETFTQPPFKHVYKNTGVFNVSMKVTDINGCSDSVTITNAVRVFGPFADFVSTDTIICTLAPVQFTNISTGIGLKYRWFLGENDSTAVVNPRKAFSNAGNFSITLRITDTANCVAEVTKPSFIKAGGQKAGFSISDSVASCPPIRINFNNQSNNAISYAWNFGNGNTSTLLNPVQTYNTPGNFRARLIITGNGGCTDTLIRNINIGGPTGTFTYGPLIGCPPLKVDFTSTRQNVKSFIWDFSDGQTEFSVDSTISHLYLNPGLYRPRVILEDGLDCRLAISGNQIIRVVGVRSLIKPLKQYQFCDTATIAFTDSSLVSSNIRLWRWDFGDGTTSDQQNPVHTFTRPGRYTVSLYVETTDNCSSISNLNQQVVIAPTPILDIGGNLDLCLPATFTFRPVWVNADTTILNIKWNFGQGDTSSLLIPPVIIYPRVGVYTTRLTVNNQYNCPTTLVRTVTVTEVADVLFGSLPVRVYCDSANIFFQENVIARAPINRWNWDFGDGNTSNNRNPTHTYTVPGTYRVKLQVNAINGCISSGDFPGTIRVVASPQVAAQRDTIFCLPINLNFAASLVPGDSSSVSWRWDLGNGQQRASASASDILFGTPGVFRASVVATNSDGCTDTSFRRVTVNDTPNVKVVQNTPVCLGQSVRLTATGADRYQWDTQPSLSCVNCSTPTARPDATIIYRVTGSTVAGCSKVDTVLVRVIFPKILQNFLGDSICLGESFRLFAFGMDQYSWSPATGLSASNIASPLATPIISTIYRLIASDSFNCFPDTAFIPVTVFPRPTVNIIQEKIVAPIGTSITLTTEFSNVTRWRWTPVSGLSCANCAQPQFTASRNIVYRVEADNEGACPATDEVEVEARCLANEIFVPNTFSPNGDGRNDRFYPQGLGVAGIKHMRIFNRWGELVFEKTNFSSNDPSQGWDGTYKGKILSPDVFVYMIDVLCSNNQFQELKGNVTLLR